MTKPGSEPVFPTTAKLSFESRLMDYIGLTKREYFAAMAMQGVLVKGYGANREERVKEAVTYADLLLAELAKGGGAS